MVSAITSFFPVINRTMPHLLSLNSYHYRRGGSDVVYFDHEEMFSGIGWATAHMSMHHPRNVDSSWSEYFVDEIEFGHEYGLVDKLKMASKVVYSVEAKRKLGSLLDRFPASVAHAHCVYHHLSPSIFPLLRERGVPTVLTAHDLKIACPAYKMLNGLGVCERCKSGNLSHLVLNKCVRGSRAVSALVAIESTVARMFGLYKNNVDKIVAPSLFYKKKLVEWGWDDERIAYVPNYVRAERHVPSYTPGDYFVYFGRLAQEKGVATLIDAAIKSGSRLKVIGGGPLENELKIRAQGSPVEFMGFRSGEALWDVVRGSRAVVLPSEWYENAPMSILEAYALGKPVIGANIGGIPEVLLPGVTGWVFDSGDSEALAGVLSNVSSMSSDALYRFGSEARQYVEATFNAKRYLNGMLEVYRQVGVNC